MCFPTAGTASTAAASISKVATWQNLAVGLQVLSGVTGAVGAYNQSKGAKSAYEYQAAVNRNNEQIAEWQAKDAIARGQKEEQQQRLKAAMLKSTQRAGFAARGVSLAEGSPLNILEDTDFMNELDVLTIRDNAAKEAWGYKNQARGYGSDAAMLSSRAKAEDPWSAASGSLLTSAAGVADNWTRRYSTKKET